MVASNFRERERELLITRMLEWGYERTRAHAEKRRIVREIRNELRKEFKRNHSALTIIKHWSDLKRRNMAWIKEIRDRTCPGVPVPYVHRRWSMDEIEVEIGSAEEEEEGEQAGPFQPQQDAPPPPDVYEKVKVEEVGPFQPQQDALPPPDVYVKVEEAGPFQPQQDAPPPPDVYEKVKVEEAGPSRQPDSPRPAPDEKGKDVTITRQEVLIKLKQKMRQMQREHDVAIKEIREQVRKLDEEVWKLEVLYREQMNEMSDLLEKLP